MTVIMGVNLSDRICLLADSRVSNIDPQSGAMTIRHDNMLKIEPLDQLSGCVIASAGDAHFAQVIIRQMNKDFKDCSIVELRQSAYDWAVAQADAYLSTNSQSMVTFLIAGVDQKSKKKIDREKFDVILESYFKGKVGEGAMRTVLDDAIKAANTSDVEIILDSNNTVLFSLKIDLRSGISIEDTVWGQALISGPTKIEKEEITDADIGKFEFEQVDLKKLEDAVDHDSLIMIAIASSMAKNKEWISVGGSYVPMHLYSNMKVATLPRRIFTTDIHGDDIQFVSAYQIIGGTFYRVDEKGTHFKMDRVSEFRPGKKERSNSKLYVQL